MCDGRRSPPLNHPQTDEDYHCIHYHPSFAYPPLPTPGADTPSRSGGVHLPSHSNSFFLEDYFDGTPIAMLIAIGKDSAPESTIPASLLRGPISGPERFYTHTSRADSHHNFCGSTAAPAPKTVNANVSFASQSFIQSAPFPHNIPAAPPKMSRSELGSCLVHKRKKKKKNCFVEPPKDEDEDEPSTHQPEPTAPGRTRRRRPKSPPPPPPLSSPFENRSPERSEDGDSPSFSIPPAPPGLNRRRPKPPPPPPPPSFSHTSHLSHGSHNAPPPIPPKIPIPTESAGSCQHARLPPSFSTPLSTPPKNSCSMDRNASSPVSMHGAYETRPPSQFHPTVDGCSPAPSCFCGSGPPSPPSTPVLCCHADPESPSFPAGGWAFVDDSTFSELSFVITNDDNCSGPSFRINISDDGSSSSPSFSSSSSSSSFSSSSFCSIPCCSLRPSLPDTFTFRPVLPVDDACPRSSSPSPSSPSPPLCPSTCFCHLCLSSHEPSTVTSTKTKPQKVIVCNKPNCTLPTVPGPMLCSPQTCEYSPPKLSCDVTPCYGVCVNGICTIKPGKTECKIEPGSWTCKSAATPTCCVAAAPSEPPKKETQITVVLQQPEAPKPQTMVVYWPMAPMPMMPIQFFQA